MAPPPKRATGANAKFRGRFQTADGVPETGNYFEFPVITWPLGQQQPLEEAVELGTGREPAAPDPGPIDLADNVTVPLDELSMGNWLKLALGDPAVSALQGARGFIVFPGNPANNDTITIGATAWTFVTAAPTGEQTQIGADLAATLAQLVIDLNASADPDIAAQTYTTVGDRLIIAHDTLDATGNGVAVLTDIVGAKVSHQTAPGVGSLQGGGLYRHEFHSAAAALPAMTVEIEFSDMEAGSNRFYLQDTLRCGTMTFNMTRAGPARAELALVGVKETPYTASQAGTPVQVAVRKFNNLEGVLLVDGVCAANVTDASLVYNNNLDIVEGVCAEGHITGQDPGKVGLTLSFTARWSNDGLKAAAEAGAPVAIAFGYLNASGAELQIEYHRMHLPKPARSISGPAGIEATYDGVGEVDATVGRSATFYLVNDKPDYANPA